MSSLVSRVKSELLNPIAIYKFLDATTKSLTIDSQLGGITGLYNLGESLRGIPSSKIAFFTIPNIPRGDVVPGDTANILWTQPEDNQIFASFRNDVPASSTLFAPATSGKTSIAAGLATRPAPGEPVKHPSGHARRDAVDDGDRQYSRLGEADSVGQSDRQARHHSGAHGQPVHLRRLTATAAPRAATVDQVKRRGWLAAAGMALCAALAVPLLAVLGPQARAAGTPQLAPAAARHVVIVGISGLTWTSVTQASHPEAMAPGRRGLGRLAGGLRAGTARLPRRRLADAELRRPRPGPAPVRVAAHGDHGRRRRQGPGDAADHPGQQAISRVTRLGPARNSRELRDRRRPRRGPRARLPGRHRLFLPAVSRGPVPVGAGPLPADRCRLGTNRGIGTGACLRHRPPASSDRRRAAPEHPASRHRSRRGRGSRTGPGPGRPAASHVGAGERAWLRRRPARLRGHEAPGDRDTHRPDPDGGRDGSVTRSRPGPSARGSAGRTGAAWTRRSPG